MRTIALRPSTAVLLSLAILSCPGIARAQSVDPYNPGANQTVLSIALQPDGKAIVGGGFTGLGGGTGATLRNHIGRLNADGTVDPGFNPGTDGTVSAVAVQTDGKILAGGNFNKAGGGTGLTSARNRIARFNADGSVDASFDPGANGTVFALALQPDGKIVVGGKFTTIGGGGLGVTTRLSIARLNADGTVDAAFNPGASKLPSPGAPPEIYTILLQPDGKIVLGGYFNGLGGGTGTTTRNFIGRLNADGTVDTGFTTSITSISGVQALALQADGKILVAGTFTQINLTNRANIGRVLSNGALDTTFNPGAEIEIFALGVQTDGKILVGGAFKWLGGDGVPGPVRNYIGRLTSDGQVDTGFDPSANNWVNAIAVQADGQILLGGAFTRLNSAPNLTTGIVRNELARITNAPAVQTLTLSNGGTTETWLRSGSGPEVSRVTFEFSFDGSFYSPLGNGTRVSGGWQFSGGPNLPTTRKVFLRARGYYETGQNGSGSIAQSIVTVRHIIDGDYDGDGKTDLTVFRPSTGVWYTSSSANGALSATPFGTPSDVPVPGDYDGDGRIDTAMYRAGVGAGSSTWLLNQTTGAVAIFAWGLAGDIPVPADYDGDGRTDLAVYRPGTGEWFIVQSSSATVVVLTLGARGDIPVAADYDGDGHADAAVYRPSSGTWFIHESTSLTTVSRQFGLRGDVPLPADYDGDGKADFAVYRPSTGSWYILYSGTGYATFGQFQWGLPGDIPVPGEYDGDGKTDIAIYRPSTGNWYIRLSSSGFATATTTQFGLPGDVPASSAALANAIAITNPPPPPPRANLAPFNDFDGDGKADISLYRPSTGTWYIENSGTNYAGTTIRQFGLSGDIPTPGDYDGDRKADIAIYRPGTGTWYITMSSNGAVVTQQWGLPSDIPVAGDYDGDGKIDIAVYRPSTGAWYIMMSRDATMNVYQWGLPTDIPVPGDYDGDGYADLAVWRPSTGQWLISPSSTNFSTTMAFQWGLNGDIAVPGDFDGDGTTDFAVWRPATGIWYVTQSSTGRTTSVAQQFGLNGDIPVAGDYNGDGKVDIAVFRPSTGVWYLLQLGSVSSYPWGLPGDIPILKRPQ